MALSAILAAVPVALCYGTRWWLDRGTLEPPWTFPLLILAGGLGGVFFSLYGYPEIEGLVESLQGAPVPPGSLISDAVLVPAAEELGKAFILLPFALTPWFRGPVDGLLYGFAAGAGFACAESFMHFAAAWEEAGEAAWLWEVVTRTVPATLVHGGATAAVGAFLGAARFDGRKGVAVAAPLIGFLAAILTHGLWNGLIRAGAETGDLRFNQVAVLCLPILFMGGALALRGALRVELVGTAPGLALEVHAGVLSTAELHAALDRRFRRRGDWHGSQARRQRLVGALLGLGLALYRYRREGRGAARVQRLRAEVAQARGRSRAD